MDSTTQVMGIIIFLLTLVISINVTQFIRRRKDLFSLREIEAYTGLPLAVGVAIEANRPLHMSFGSAGLGGRSTVLALAAAEYFYHVARQAAVGDVSPILTLTDSSALPLAQDTLRRAYQSRGLINKYHSNNARWYPAGSRSLAFAAAITAMMSADKTSSHIMAGSFGAELALVMDLAFRRNQSVIAVSDQLEGQAIAYAMGEPTLIGEEIFAAGTYLSGDASQKGATVTVDILRWLLIIAIFILMAVSVLQEIGG